jgi:hypothetical protein
MSLPKKNGELNMNLKYIFLVMAFTLATIASANADTTCAVNSPDGELNVRELTSNGPGKVIDVLKNGYTVTIRDFYLLKGKSWARVVDGKTKTKVVGWIFKDHLNCNIQAATPKRSTTLVELKTNGVWKTYSDVTKKGETVIGMYTAVANNSAFYIKYFAGENRLYVQIFRDGWQFPEGGVAVPFRITFDNSSEPYSATGHARMDSGKAGQMFALVESFIDDPELAGDFVNAMSRADKMTITFEQGDETPWVVDMKGSREASTAFMNAVGDLCSKATNCGKATQPYNATKPTTQPYNAAKKNERGA